MLCSGPPPFTAAPSPRLTSLFISVNQNVDVAFIANIRSKIFPALHIGLAIGLDTDITVTGSCSFRTGTPGPDGTPIAVGVSLRQYQCFLCVALYFSVSSFCLSLSRLLLLPYTSHFITPTSSPSSPSLHSSFSLPLPPLYPRPWSALKPTQPTTDSA